jgi:hypothetical protein
MQADLIEGLIEDGAHDKLLTNKEAHMIAHTIGVFAKQAAARRDREEARARFARQVDPLFAPNPNVSASSGTALPAAAPSAPPRGGYDEADPNTYSLEEVEPVFVEYDAEDEQWWTSPG